MEQCEPPSEHEHPWKDATLKRRAWAKSRDSWQAPESQDDAGSEECPPVPAAEPMEEKPSAAKEPGRNNKIASWLEDCRTPLGASLDEQSGTPTKGVTRNGCSFEDDLSLGAEANHLQPNGTKAEVPCYGVPAREKRTQFKQKGRSMNSTGSGRSNTTVSSVSELLDLYEEDPEEILYNLGFGREEPNISSKVPSRFFNSTSGARGIDIKVYLSAQLQRMELENPNYALTSRFRQIEVLTTVANAFSSLYSQVSGLPVQKIGNVSSVSACASPSVGGGASVDAEGDAKDLPPVPRARTHSHSTLNAVKILKTRLTRHNLHAPAGSPEAGTGTGTTAAAAAAATNSDPGSPATGAGGGVGASNVSAEEHTRLAEVKPQKAFRKKDSPSLATVAEEAGQGSSESNGDASDPATPAATAATPASESRDDQAQPQSVAQEEGPALGMETPVLVSISGVSEESDGGGLIGDNAKELGGDLQRAITSTPDKEPSNLLPNPLLDHLRTSPQARESFEMDELQEDEPGTRSTSRAGSELLRTASQQSDSSGFAEDPCADCSANYLKVQESSDSCDSETTVTSHAGDSAASLSTDAAALEPDAQAVLQTHGEEEEQEEEEEEKEEGKKEVPEYTAHHFTRAADAIATQPVGSADERGLTTTGSTAEAGVPLELSSPMEAPAARELGSPAEPGSTAEREVTADPASECSLGGSPEGSKPSASDLVRTALHRAQERSALTGEDRTSRPAPATSADRGQELRKARLGRMQRSSSLPTSLLSPSRVVSSLRVQLGHGSVRHCATPTFSYRYTPDPDAALEDASIREEGHREEEEEEDEEEDVGEEGRRSSCRTTLIIKSPTAAATSDGPFSRTPMSAVPGHLTLSNSSLHSGPLHDWTQQRALGEGGGWSSVPNLALGQQQHAPSPAPHHHHHHPHQQLPPHQLPHFRSPYPPVLGSSAYNSLNSSFSGAFPQGSSYTPSPSPTPFFTPPHSAFFTPPQSASMLNSAPYGPLSHSASPYNSPYHHPQQQQQQADGRYGSPLPPHGPSPVPSYSPLVHPHSAPYSLPYSTPPPGRLGQPYGAQYSGPPCFPFPHETPAAPPPVSTTEMQLRRVLHEIRGTVQSLARASTPGPDDMPTDAFSPHRSVQTLYEDLQMRKRSLCVFRTQMMDLELSLMRQQSQVYQHLSQEERMEAEQLQGLRGSVRQELQELELQVEDRLLALNEQVRAVQHRGLYCHPMAMHRGHSLDSMSNASALEPMSDLLREQLYLQSELGYEGGLSRATTPMSGRSSGTVSPVRSHRAASGRSSPQRGALYRATVCLTPAPPPRPGVEAPEQPPAGAEEEVDGEGRTKSCSPAVEQGSQPAINPHLLQERGREEAAAAAAAGADRGADNPHLQQLIKEIKDSIANEIRQEIRQEIVSELLAAVSPRRAVAVSREQP